MTPQEANAQGLNWVPEDHPLYGTQGFVGYQQQQPAAGAAANPNAPPSMTTTNQGFQNTLRDQVLQKATQGTNIDMNAPVIKQQVDVFRQEQDRARRDRQMAMAERYGARGAEQSGAMDAEIAASHEDVGRATGGFAAALGAQELAARRNEIADALRSGLVMIESDQGRMLQMKLAEMDAALRRQGYDVQRELGMRDIGLRGELGRGGLALDAARLAQGDRHFGQNLGFQMADKEAYYNQQALLSLLGGY